MGHDCGGTSLEQWDFAYSFKFKKITERFEQLWTMKASARESLKDWLVVSNISPRTAEICANACSELIENSIKYTPEQACAEVSIQVRGSEITVQTSNPAHPEHIDALHDSLTALHEASDPQQVFVQKLMNPTEGKSQLGLIKIIVETKGTLNMKRTPENNTICMRLQMQAE